MREYLGDLRTSPLITSISSELVKETTSDRSLSMNDPWKTFCNEALAASDERCFLIRDLFLRLLEGLERLSLEWSPAHRRRV